MTSALEPVSIDAPLVNPAPTGLVAATAWTEDPGPLRWLPAGVQVRVFNYGGDASFKEWTAAWDAKQSDLTEDDVKVAGPRPEIPDAFTAITLWASDDGAPAAWSQDEVRTRAEQIYRLKEPIATETALAGRMLTDAGTLDTADDLVGALSHIEGLFAKTSTVGAIHASATWAASAAQANLVRYQNGKLVTPLGHQWVFGGGYVDALQDKLVATSPTFGFRGPLAVRDGVAFKSGRYQAIAERSLVVGYEALIGAVNVTG